LHNEHKNGLRRRHFVNCDAHDAQKGVNCGFFDTIDNDIEFKLKINTACHTFINEFHGLLNIQMNANETMNGDTVCLSIYPRYLQSIAPRDLIKPPFSQRRINRPSAMKTRSPSVTDLNRPSIRPRSHHRDPGAISRAQALRATPAPSRANYPHNGHINGAHRPSEFRIFSFPRAIINNVAGGINNVISISHAPQIDR
jgi:hypothetical protein